METVGEKGTPAPLLPTTNVLKTAVPTDVVPKSIEETVIPQLGTAGANVAVTVCAAVTAVAHGFTNPEEHVPLPPDQPEKTEPAFAVAVSVTVVPLLYGSEQSAPQLIPAGLLVTVPDPVPSLVTDKVNCCGAKVAVTVLATFIFTTQLPVPEHPPPDQPVNVEPLDGAAIRVTDVLKL